MFDYSKMNLSNLNEADIQLLAAAAAAANAAQQAQAAAAVQQQHSNHSATISRQSTPPVTPAPARHSVSVTSTRTPTPTQNGVSTFLTLSRLSVLGHIFKLAI